MTYILTYEVFPHVTTCGDSAKLVVEMMTNLPLFSCRNLDPNGSVDRRE